MVASFRDGSFSLTINGLVITTNSLGIKRGPRSLNFDKFDSRAQFKIGLKMIPTFHFLFCWRIFFKTLDLESNLTTDFTQGYLEGPSSLHVRNTWSSIGGGREESVVLDDAYWEVITIRLDKKDRFAHFI